MPRVFALQLLAMDKEAIQKCKEQEFDFILMDLQMPDINGFEVIKNLKKEDLSSAKFIVITAYSIPELEEQVNQLGIHAFLKNQSSRSYN